MLFSLKVLRQSDAEVDASTTSLFYHIGIIACDAVSQALMISVMMD